MMKTTATAGDLAAALALADSLIDARVVKRKLPGLCAVHLKATIDMLTISTNVLDHALALTVPATVEVPGEVAVSAVKLAGLAAGFPAKAMVEISADGATARVASGRSRFKLPTVAPDLLPPTLTLGEESGRVELAREEAVALFSRPAFAVETSLASYHRCGIFLHDTDAGLAAVATDGYRLIRVTVPGATGFSADHTLIVPTTALEIILKLLRAKDIERLTLRRSRTLFAIEGSRFAFVSKLVDGTYPDYQRIVPAPSGNTVTVDRAELAQALARIAAVADPAAQVAPLVGFEWSADAPSLRLCLAGWPELANDELSAETHGAGKIALNVRQLREMLDAIDSERIRFASNGEREPLRVTDPDDADVLAVQMPSVWPFQNAQAA
jgi:DNA polymerase-3 subunit beta